MNKPDTTIIEQDWPEDELEEVHNCPYCNSTKRSIAYQNVQDWSFYCAPGKWTYWDCEECKALYLNPRPTEDSIGKAYASYYTHNSNTSSIVEQVKMRLRNEVFYHIVNADLNPRLHAPKWLSFVIKSLKKLVYIPFELEPLANLPKGKLLDVGCGSGNMLKIAKQLGWDVTGLEMDPNAVKAAQALSLNVIQGDYRLLSQFKQNFDCVICSHVLEHVHNPLELLDLLQEALKHGGTLLLSLPNAKSHVRHAFGESWRGLEAPRHIAIPTDDNINNFFRRATVEHVFVKNITILESKKIKSKSIKYSFSDKLYLQLQRFIQLFRPVKNTDFIQIVLTK